METISTLTYLKFKIGGCFGNCFEVTLNKKTITYHTNESLYSIGYKHKKKISTENLDIFISKLNEIRVNEWKDDYDSYVLDGEQWELKLSYNNQLKKRICGNNCYPNSEPNSIDRTDVFNNFMAALVLLIQEPTFFTESFSNKP